MVTKQEIADKLKQNGKYWSDTLAGEKLPSY
jgi:hypothetical protein